MTNWLVEIFVVDTCRLGPSFFKFDIFMSAFKYLFTNWLVEILLLLHLQIRLSFFKLNIFVSINCDMKMHQ